ncbi:peptidase M23-like protein [Stackebrandtia endophytica]|uniref:Peptidase M23-like protein n=1 Tax=Stackebrandtia endophytica TaxID=1496996 RepID=A0A543B0G7_9ACTN|nr:peptidoglycan DD-metalloendopeptidase family protein [Stackebrandtia endophytica]TQL78286.1 peptidase M23-like protein [Stackebrandtia endophytica]
MSSRPQLSRRNLLRGSAVALGAGLSGVALAGTASASDFYNPFAGYPISDGWAEHVARGSLGGIDYPMSVGTTLPACGGGTVTNNPNNGTGGYTVTIAHPNGYRSQYLHLSGFLLANGTVVSAGAAVGLSGGAAGAPGSGSSTGPHCHWHMINPSGTRINPLEFLGGGGGGGLPKTSTEQDGIPGPIFWKRVQNWVRIDAGYTGPIDGAPGPNTYAAMQRYLAAHHGYGGPADGDPGPNTYAALQRLAAQHGYTGPIDGEMGPNSWRGVARFVNQNRFD